MSYEPLEVDDVFTSTHSEYYGIGEMLDIVDKFNDANDLEDILQSLYSIFSTTLELPIDLELMEKVIRRALINVREFGIVDFFRYSNFEPRITNYPITNACLPHWSTSTSYIYAYSIPDIEPNLMYMSAILRWQGTVDKFDLPKFTSEDILIMWQTKNIIFGRTHTFTTHRDDHVVTKHVQVPHVADLYTGNLTHHCPFGVVHKENQICQYKSYYYGGFVWHSIHLYKLALNFFATLCAVSVTRYRVLADNKQYNFNANAVFYANKFRYIVQLCKEIDDETSMSAKELYFHFRRVNKLYYFVTLI